MAIVETRLAHAALPGAVLVPAADSILPAGRNGNHWVWAGSPKIFARLPDPQPEEDITVQEIGLFRRVLALSAANVTTKKSTMPATAGAHRLMVSRFKRYS
jgi:hypothetical protein